MDGLPFCPEERLLTFCWWAPTFLIEDQLCINTKNFLLPACWALILAGANKQEEDILEYI